MTSQFQCSYLASFTPDQTHDSFRRVDAQEESQEVVDEFFQQANMIAEAGKDLKQRKQKLAIYKDRRKTEASDGIVNGINNW